MNMKKNLTVKQRAFLAGVAVSHYYGVMSGKSRCGLSKYQAARKIAALEKKHILHILCPELYDEKGRVQEQYRDIVWPKLEDMGKEQQNDGASV